jgi:hypothetical protein
MEDTNKIESANFSINDDTLITLNNGQKKNLALNKSTMTQFDALTYKPGVDAFIEKLSTETGYTVEDLRGLDIIFGKTRKGESISAWSIDPTGLDLSSEYGLALQNGSNGAFGDAPVGTSAWAAAIVEVFENTTGDHDEVYDVDQHKIAAICDANYPDNVKNAIFDFVEFRKDCVFLRDFGVGNNTFVQINKRYNDFSSKRNYFTADYGTSYLINDPLTKKTIEVTMTYDIAAILVSHIENSPYAPLAGTANNFILPSAIKGTINFTPVNTPKANQKEAMDNIRVNYAIFEDNQCVVQSSYTSQDAYTQLSYLNNVMGIQRVLRAVRTACPRQRYSLATSSDLQVYANAVNSVLSNYTNNFATLNFKYTQDSLRASQKIFYASIEFAFLGWAQTEIFDVYAINE